MGSHDAAHRVRVCACVRVRARARVRACVRAWITALHDSGRLHLIQPRRQWDSLSAVTQPCRSCWSSGFIGRNFQRQQTDRKLLPKVKFNRKTTCRLASDMNTYSQISRQHHQATRCHHSLTSLMAMLSCCNHYVNGGWIRDRITLEHRIDWRYLGLNGSNALEPRAGLRYR